MTKLRTRLRALARLGLLLALLALGGTLVVSAWANRSAAEQISALLDRGQAERFFRPIPRLHEKNAGAATSEELAQLLAQFREEGLRYLVAYDADGNVLSEAGRYLEAERPRPTAGGSASQPLVIGDRVRMTFRPPPHTTAPGGARLPVMVLEFEPTVSNQLRQRASSSFIFSLTAAASLLALTVGLWLSLLREDARRERSERERQLAALGEMSAVLAHEIRNPLASLKGHAQLLGEQLEASSPLQKKVGRIVDEAKRLEELTRTLLDLVRSSSVDRQPINPATLLREAADAVDGARIAVDSRQAPDSWSLDGLRMEQVLKNLLQNAVQASPAEAAVEAAIGLERGQLVISVRDHGAGLPVGQEQRIFEPFHTTRTQGTGLGLAIARRIVELHGGQLHAENHAQGGAVFRLSIPAGAA